MKKFLISILTLFLIVTGYGFHILPDKPQPAQKLYAYAEETSLKEENIQISIVGNSSKMLTPNYATICVCLDVDDNDSYKNLIDKLHEKGVKEDEVKLEYYSSFPVGLFTFGEHKSHYNFNITVFNLENLNEIIQSLEDGGAQILNLNYSVSNIDEEYSLIIDDAIKDAKQKAAKILNREDFQVVGVKEKSVFYSNLIKEENNPSIEIEGRVEVVFE